MNIIDPAAVAQTRQHLRATQIRLLQEHAHVTQILTHLEALCPHDWIPQGHVGPYEERICRHCNAHDFVK